MRENFNSVESYWFCLGGSRSYLIISWASKAIRRKITYGENLVDDGEVLSSDDLVVGGYRCKIPRQEFTDAFDRMVGWSEMRAKTFRVAQALLDQFHVSARP